jgi:succinate dehydrogenase/fumarate reductase flavoprotein subunit
VEQSRYGSRKGLTEAIEEIALREEFYKDVKVPGDANSLSKLDKAGRVADFLELGELFAKDALHRNESCGGHFREEYQSEDAEMMKILLTLLLGSTLVKRSCSAQDHSCMKMLN